VAPVFKNGTPAYERHAQLAKTGVGVEKVGQEKVFWVEYVLADLFFSQFA
jgi:hypothetical protein